jgi:hypothetical protein
LHGAGDGGFIRRGHFGKFATAQQQRPHPGWGQGPAFPQHNQPVSVTDIQLVTGFDPRLFANGLRNDHLSFD